MAAKRKGLYEVRTRVTCNLPVNDGQEEKAFLEVLEFLNDLRHQGLGVSGYTHSESRLAVFHGYWWPNDADEPVHDQIVLCTVDYRLAFGSQELSLQVKKVKQTIRKCYRYYGSPPRRSMGCGAPDHPAGLKLLAHVANDDAANLRRQIGASSPQTNLSHRRNTD